MDKLDTRDIIARNVVGEIIKEKKLTGRFCGGDSEYFFSTHPGKQPISMRIGYNAEESLWTFVGPYAQTRDKEGLEGFVIDKFHEYVSKRYPLSYNTWRNVDEIREIEMTKIAGDMVQAYLLWDKLLKKWCKKRDSLINSILK